MAEKEKPDQPVLACEICLKEIPGDVAHTHEGSEYVHHFCGLDCYRRWQQEKAKEEAGPGTDAK